MTSKTSPPVSLSPDPSASAGPAPRRLGVLAVLGLALLAVPRAVLHDLDLLHEGTAVNLVLVVVPPVVWIAVVLARRVRSPFLTLVAVGVVHGVLLALTHQLLWSVALGDAPPRLGGNLAGLDPTAQAVILRGAAAASSVATGTVLGVLTGVVAAVLSRPRRDRRPVR